jgi:hypothetical protein
MIVEPFAGDSLAENISPVGRLYYGFSTMICTPGSLSQEVGLALGAQAGERRSLEGWIYAGPPCRRNSSANRTAATNALIRKVFDTAGPYSTFITAAYVDLIRTEFGTLQGESVTIPDAPTIDDKNTLLRFFTHPLDEFPL